MTDLVHAGGGHAPMVSRQAVTPSGVTPPAHLGAFKPENLQVAETLARTKGDVIPRDYQGNPGACLLALDWAERNGVAIMEVMAEVSFNRGRATVGARMQRKLASRHGYITRKVEGDAESCTVAVVGPTGTEVGRATYTFAQAEALGIVYQKDGRTLKPTWAGDPGQMLYHRATTRALDHYGPSELSGTFVDEWDEPDPIRATIERPAPEVTAAADEPATPTGDGGDVITEEDLRAAAKVPDIMRAASKLGANVGLVADVVADQDLARAVLAEVTA